MDGQPHEVLEFNQMKKAQRAAVAQTKIKNLLTGKVFEKNFHEGENFEEADLSKVDVRFIFGNRGKYVFCEVQNPSKRYEFSEEQLGNVVKFLKSDEILTGLVFEDKIINVAMPIKVAVKVTESAPGVRGDRAQGGTKVVTVETGAAVNTPLFIQEGDMIEINTETGDYVRRITK